MESPYPYDLRADLLAHSDGREPGTSGTPAEERDGRSTTNPAAEDGRVDP